MCDLCYPRSWLNQTQTSRRRLPEEETWWYLNVEKCELNWMTEERLHWGGHDKITIDYQLNMHLVSNENHVTPWRSINLNRKGNMPQYDIKCMVDRKIKQSQIIHHQMHDPGHPYPQLNQVQTSKRFLPEEEAWWYLNINQISNTCLSRGCWRQHLISWPQGGLKTWDVM